MRKFLRNILLFGLPFGVLLGWLLASSPGRAYSYNMIQKDCRTGGWMFRRLHESPAPVDVAFVGTSKTMCDINDSLLQHRLRTEHGREMQVANFGVCRLGENLHWLLARDLFAQKHPRYLVVEVSTEMATNSHFHFPYLAASKDVLGAPLWANSDYLSDLTQLCWNRLVYQREHLLGIDRKFEDYLNDSLHSFMVVANDIVADSAEMARVKTRRQKNLSQALPSGPARWVYDAAVRPAKHYFRSMADLCRQNGAGIIFLYLPEYGTPTRSPQELAFFQEMGPVWIPPDSIFGNPSLHMDHSHLNMHGARKLSDWLTANLAAL
ncbi:MAG TPA: hypothetical protein VHS96_14400, partial [Bacteroidia bacterium]|nr:hypothetical protein [Bacteroidia bacterium]